jgi:ankyrin repeat protein
LTVSDSQTGHAPLLLAWRSGSLEIAEIRVVAGAGVSAANYQGDTPLLAAVGAGKFELAEMLVSKAKADVIVINGDGASALHLVIASRELLGMVCALMASAVTERAMQDRLSHVRAFINCHIDLLQDLTPLAPLTVTDVVKQLALQESDSVFDSTTDSQWNAPIERGVVWVNKPPGQHACRWTMQAGGDVQSLADSSDGSKMARAEGNDVVACDAGSGFEVHRLKGHR